MGSSDTPTPAPLITARGVTKQFAGERALAGVDFELRPGEIHALLGENGAGKSTLIKILAGVVPPDGGDIDMLGTRLSHRFTPADVSAAGVAFVHQDLGLVDDLSVSENIALAVGYHKRGGLISFPRSARAAAGLLADLGMSIAPGRLVGDLTQDEKVMVAVARAFATHAKAIVLDEVSSSLPAPEVERLMESLSAARVAGVGYVYVTHRLSEVFAIADRVTVLRDGAVVASAPVAGLAHEQLVEWILGSAGVAEYAPNAARVASVEPERSLRLEVDGLLAPGLTEPISFTARQGEIIGVCGLVGCGARELARVLGGASAPTEGEARLDGEALPLGSAGALRRAGCTYVPGDRQVEGGVLDMSVRENLFLNRRLAQPGESPAQAGDVPGRFIYPPRERKNAAQMMGQFDVRPRGAIDRPLSSLSGGNQQKVICGRALRSKPRLLVVDDPTAGVDVASRAQLHAILRATAAEGTTIILASTDFDEVASEADRALVMVAGRTAEILAGPDLTSDRLARASYGAAPDPVSGGKR